MSLRELLADAAGSLDDVETALAPDGAISWSRSGHPFAGVSADGASAEFALDPAVAAAAVRTPDVEPSSRGAGWVAFAPQDLDDRTGRSPGSPRPIVGSVRATDP